MIVTQLSNLDIRNDKFKPLKMIILAIHNLSYKYTYSI